MIYNLESLRNLLNENLAEAQQFLIFVDAFYKASVKADLNSMDNLDFDECYEIEEVISVITAYNGEVLFNNLVANKLWKNNPVTINNSSVMCRLNLNSLAYKIAYQLFYPNNLSESSRVWDSNDLDSLQIACDWFKHDVFELNPGVDEEFEKRVEALKELRNEWLAAEMKAS